MDKMIDSTPIMKDYADMESAATTKIDSKIPEGPVAEKWTNYKAHQKLVNPANKRNLDIIVVGTGLGGASAAAFEALQPFFAGFLADGLLYRICREGIQIQKPHQ